ncbi:hypothetical protein LSTR_LSTR005311 [Laodelphax striatellus]|uniref:RRM domain-containing protein n=1 Tax=Laodelphax striatellus TaxID=195883 RepID=A0A482X7H5_LAOST|nr:hypothetical protein LSTR_LSTR005311 [Laodelphax striatellus]
MGDVQIHIGGVPSRYSFTQLDGQIIFRRLDPHGEEIQGPVDRRLKIVVKNIPSECNARELLRLFLKAGVINEMRVMVAHGDFCKGFVKYESPFECKMAKSVLNGYTFPGRKKLIVEESKEFHEIVFSGIPSTVSMNCIETFFKIKFCDEGLGEVRQLSSCGDFMKVAVAFSSHRTAALAWKEFSRKKRFLWNSHITAECPGTAKHYKRTAPGASQPRTPNLIYMTKWEGVEDSLLTKEFWIEHFGRINENYLVETTPK